MNHQPNMAGAKPAVHLLASFVQSLQDKLAVIFRGPSATLGPVSHAVIPFASSRISSINCAPEPVKTILIFLH